MILSILGLWSLALHHEYNALLTEKDAKDGALAKLKKKFQRTEMLENTYTALLTRSRLLEQQSGHKFSPVSLMDSVSRSLNPLSLWLLRFGVDGKHVEIEGRGLQSEDILKFVDTLEQTAPWGNLLAIEMQKESYQSIPVYRFSLKFTMDG